MKLSMTVRKSFKRRMLYTVVFFAALFLISWGAREGPFNLTHVHGLAYTYDGKQILVPSHHGLAVYSAGEWSRAAGPLHDYMGFAATRQYLYSSGHPAPGSGLTNPFGLIRSADGGASWTKLGLEGESDFHLLAAGYFNNAVYVYNAARNSRMDQPGIYYTVNDGFEWRSVEAFGLTGKLTSLAVHPTNVRVVAAGTDAGVFVSKDYGMKFAPLIGREQAWAVYFSLDGTYLWASTFGDEPKLTRIEWMTGKQTPAKLPPLSRDAVTYIAQNPANSSEIAVATLERSIFLSRDGAQTWTQIAASGQGL